MNTKKRIPSEKLIMTQFDKNNYIVEGRLLYFYLDQGMILQTSPMYSTRIHKILICTNCRQHSQI